jgi:hypothetical protein
MLGWFKGHCSCLMPGLSAGGKRLVHCHRDNNHDTS